MFFLGYDIGSSSIKASLLEADTGKVTASAVSPKTEMPILAARPGWAEQHPRVWWDHIVAATAEIGKKAGGLLKEVGAIGVSYQMHGLVMVDQSQTVLRPAIIWCDSRAVEIGERAFADLGPRTCLQRLLNSPGNFTASRLKWVKENEPEMFSRVHKFMLPGDYVVMRMTGEIRTTASGLSEGILWDFETGDLAKMVLEYFGISADLVPRVVATFSIQGDLTREAAAELGLKPGTKISYRAGDQPNNAFSLNVLNPGEMAATAGTSGVIYGVAAKAAFDPKSRVNSFIHVNHAPGHPRYGIIACVNGTGILNRWLRDQLGLASAADGYESMNALAVRIPPGSEGLMIFPYGNGAERTLANKIPGASMRGIQFNIHDRGHLARAVQEGIVFALKYGVEILRGMGLDVETVKAGQANMFLSPVFAEIFAAATGARVDLVRTDGSQGAARGAGLGTGFYRNVQEAFMGLERAETILPDPNLVRIYQEIYQKWADILEKDLTKG